jgi:hypothetical protein
VEHHFTRALVKAALDHVEQVASDEERRAIWDQIGRDGDGDGDGDPAEHAVAHSQVTGP